MDQQTRLENSFDTHQRRERNCFNRHSYHTVKECKRTHLCFDLNVRACARACACAGACACACACACVHVRVRVTCMHTQIHQHAQKCTHNYISVDKCFSKSGVLMQPISAGPSLCGHVLRKCLRRHRRATYHHTSIAKERF